MSPTVPPPRLHILTARTEPVAVILRRGPSKWCHVLRYRANTDEIEHGSWFRGRIYEFRCDLSDDGRYMVYLAMGDQGETWNGVCKPPRLTCIAQWRTMGTWYGGGVWTSDRRLKVNIGRGTGAGWIRKFKPDYPDSRRPKIEFGELQPEHGGEDENVLYNRLQRDGWVRVGPFGTDVKLPGNQFQIRHDGDSGWRLNRRDVLPEMRLFFRGYFAGEGRRFEFEMPEHPGVLDGGVQWAARVQDQLLVARRGVVERWSPTCFARGEPAFRLDLSECAPPSRSE